MLPLLLYSILFRIVLSLLMKFESLFTSTTNLFCPLLIKHKLCGGSSRSRNCWTGGLKELLLSWILGVASSWRNISWSRWSLLAIGTWLEGRFSLPLELLLINIVWIILLNGNRATVCAHGNLMLLTSSWRRKWFYWVLRAHIHSDMMVTLRTRRIHGSSSAKTSVMMPLIRMI